MSGLSITLLSCCLFSHICSRPLINLSIDLISASHVHILEPQWNPMTESQAVGRVHRIGQTKQVFVTRYVVRRSIETVSTYFSWRPNSPKPRMVLAKISRQYVQWVQKDKLQVISQSLDFEPPSQADVDQQRWQVSLDYRPKFNQPAQTDSVSQLPSNWSIPCRADSSNCEKPGRIPKNTMRVSSQQFSFSIEVPFAPLASRDSSRTSSQDFPNHLEISLGPTSSDSCTALK